MPISISTLKVNGMVPDTPHSDTPHSDAPHADARLMETLTGCEAEFPKDQEDIAVAVVALRNGVVSEWKLTEALRSWTIHGSLALVDHLAQVGSIDGETRQKLATEASELLTTVIENGEINSAGDSLIANTLEALDPSGRISRLLGIQAAVGIDTSDASDRRSAMHGYRLIRKIGQGGLGRVWLAFDESLQRYVAIKEISGVDTPLAVERFNREAVITGRLEHPGIVPIYQLGIEESTGKSFYVMRFLGKTTLHDAIMEYHERRVEGNDDPMLIRRLLDDFVNVCQALGHAHSRHVIHRDLKPENIAIDSFGQVIVIDWGIAKVVGEVNPGESRGKFDSAEISSESTMHGQVLGTPLYMAPEQAAGRVDDLDERTDIYGLGAILFAILTGSAPHEGAREQSQATGARDMLSAITSRPTPNPLEVDSKVDAALAAICCKAMARKQYARYQSAMKLAEDVQRWMAGEPVSAQREKFAHRVKRWIRHHQVWSQVIAACVIITIVAASTLAVALRQGHLTEQQRQFDELSIYSSEVEVQLQSTAIELMRNTRFMSTLPPIQAIVDARIRVEDADESEEVWQERLATIYAGLLQANPNYRRVYFTAIDSKQAAPIVWVERHAGQMGLVRRLPASRIAPLSDQDLLTQIHDLSLSDILLTTRYQNKATRKKHQDVSLLASTPVFDEQTGEIFGLVTVELDLLGRAIQALQQLEQTTATIFVTNSAGEAWLSDDPIAGINTMPHKIKALPKLPNAAGYFQDPEQNHTKNQNQGWIANRITLDPSNPETTVGLILQLND